MYLAERCANVWNSAAGCPAPEPLAKHPHVCKDVLAMVDLEQSADRARRRIHLDAEAAHTVDGSSPAPTDGLTNQTAQRRLQNGLLTTHQLLMLQRTAGNNALQRLLVQRHSIEGAPPPPEEEQPIVQRQAAREFPPAAPVGRSLEQRPGQAAFGRGSVLASTLASPDSPARLVQRNGAGGQMRFGQVTFNPQPLKNDGAATSQAAAAQLVAKNLGAPTWTVKAPAYGTTISASGLITAGQPADVVAGDKQITVQAAAAQYMSSGALVLTHPSKLERATFLNDGPYKFPNYTTGLNGKFDVEYSPSARVAKAIVKVKFELPATMSKGDKRTFRQEYVTRITDGWSKRYNFENVRQPASIWGHLNPVRFEVVVLQVDTGQHFTIEAKAANQGNAYIGGGVAHLGTNLAPNQWANLPGGPGDHEVERVKKIAPDIPFAADSHDLGQGAKDTLSFLATYLSRISNPHFTLALTGFGAKAADATARANAVMGFLRAKGLTAAHTVTVNAAGAGDKTTIAPSLTNPGWQNMQDVTRHEFGHMIGLDDEYDAGRGAITTHYSLVEKALGKDYAEKTSRTDITTYSASVMQSGDDVRIQHYVTFWEALVETTLQKANVPTPKFGYADWKFVGGG